MGNHCKMLWILAATLCVLVIGHAEAALWEFGGEGEQDICDLTVLDIMEEDRQTIADESPSRLHAVWISQECEVRAGPEYIIRKYTFFENGTFQLMRHYYAEESCSIATHTVTARGVIKLLGNSLVTPGATETRYQLDTVHISPLNRQVAHKLGHRVNVSCGPQPRWRPYTAQPVYERAPEHFGAAGSMTWQGPRYNSLHQGIAATATGFKTKRVDCLSPLNIDFDELRLIRVQKKPMGFRSAPFGGNDEPRMELYLGALPPDQASKRSHRPTSLQPTPLLRTDTIHNCPICGAIARGTENSPPLLHEVVALPALIGGAWVSPTCESHPGGVWVRRQMRVYAGDQLWTGRWDYHNDPRCDNLAYTITAAGSYVQRARRHRRHEANINGEEELGHEKLHTRTRRNSDKHKLTTWLNYSPENTTRNEHGLKRIIAFMNRLTKEDEERIVNILHWYLRKERFTKEFSKDLWALLKPVKSQKKGEVPTIGEFVTALKELDERASEIEDPHRWLKEHKKVEFIDINSMWERAMIKANMTEIEKRNEILRSKRATDEIDYYQHLLQTAQPSMAESFAAMLRGNQRSEETTKKPLQSVAPTGTTELDLHVAETLLIANDLSLAQRCGYALQHESELDGKQNKFTSWPSSCVPHTIDSPSTLGLRARISVDWYGQYTLWLGARDKTLWDAPLLSCGPAALKNFVLQKHLRRSVGLKFGILFNSTPRSADGMGFGTVMLFNLLALWFGYYAAR